MSVVELVNPEEDIVDITKRTADGEPLPKQPRLIEEEVEEQTPMAEERSARRTSSTPQVQMELLQRVPRTYALPADARKKAKKGKAKDD